MRMSGEDKKKVIGLTVSELAGSIQEAYHHEGVYHY